MKIVYRTAFVVGSIVLSTTLHAEAAGVKDCDAALVKATYKRTDRQFLDWRLAEQVDQASYDAAKADAGASAVIYGIPMGANYSQFRENIQSSKKSRTESFKLETFRNVAWTGLDASSVAAYSECLKAVSKKQLILLPVTATSNDVSFNVEYSVVGNGENPLPVKWQGVASTQNNLPSSIWSGTTPIVLKRPKSDSTLTVAGNGLADSVVITPMPPLPEVESGCEITKTPQPLPQLPRNASTFWTCPGLKAGNYDVSVSMKPSASGAFRVLYAVETLAGSGGSQRRALIGSGNMDINAPGSGLPDVFQGSGQVTVAKDGESVRILLTVQGVANHCCFHTTSHADGTVLVPEGVKIEIKRVGA